jgi:cystathionine gamma-synthase
LETRKHYFQSLPLACGGLVNEEPIMKIRVISQQPPGGRCTLYAGYAEALARHFGVPAERVWSAERGAHGNGFPSLWLDEVAVQPEDGAILMPADILAALSAAGIEETERVGLAEALEAPLERLLGEAG